MFKNALPFYKLFSGICIILLILFGGIVSFESSFSDISTLYKTMGFTIGFFSIGSAVLTYLLRYNILSAHKEINRMDIERKERINGKFNMIFVLFAVGHAAGAFIIAAAIMGCLQRIIMGQNLLG